jgi:hypothetical protein
VVSLPLTLGRTQVPVEPATCDAGRSVSPSHIWHDHREFHDESLVLLPLRGYCQRSIRFYCCMFIIIIINFVNIFSMDWCNAAH